MSDIPHPRETMTWMGHEAAQQILLDAVKAQRLHHAWLLSGPPGIGKATLAYHFARVLLAHPPDQAETSLFGEPAPLPNTLNMSADHAVARRVAAGGHGNLRTVERGFDDKRKVLRSEIVVEDIRRMTGLFTSTGAEPGYRIAIIDSADDMNRNAANALLKLLEEPPRHSLFLLISHAPGRLLPTIRSRCRQLTLDPPSPEHARAVVQAALPDLAADEMTELLYWARGAPGRAIALGQAEALELIDLLDTILGALPHLPGPRLHALAQNLAAKAAEDRFTLFCELLMRWTEAFIRTTATQDNPAPGPRAKIHAHLATLAPGPAWLALRDRLVVFLPRADGLNLDRKQLVLSLFDAYQAVAAGRPLPI